MRALEKDPAERFSSVQALREALQSVSPTPGAAPEPVDADSLATRLVTTPLRVALPPVAAAVAGGGGARHAQPRRALRASRCRSARSRCAAFLLGAKLVRQQPAAEELAVTAAAATRTGRAAAARAAADRAARSAAPASVAAPKRAPRRLASPRKRRATIGAGSRRAGSARARPSLGGTSG